MRELSVAEQRYQAVMAVIGDGLTVSQAAEKTGVARQTLPRWLARYEAQGLDGLADRSHRPVRCPRQMTAPQDQGLSSAGPKPGQIAVGCYCARCTERD